MLLATLFQLVGLAASPLTVNYFATGDSHSELILRYLNAVQVQNVDR
jgi:hypothetical protein